MFKQKKLHYAVVSAMAATAGSGAANAAIEEVVVTASKRATSMQDIPITVQAMEESDLKEQRIDSFDDYVKYLPGVTFGGRGPGQNTIYVRGVAVNTVNTTLAEANGNEPNVGLYLDEQPVTANGRNLDVYVSDMARIEVLPGPQGTLYGASSMAGTVRLITNKPQINGFEASVNAKTGFTKDGDMSNSVDGVLNIPVINDKLAVRIAMFADHKGGYIDNKSGTFTADSDINASLAPKEGIVFVPTGGSPTAHQCADGNYAVPGQVYPVEYKTVSNADLAEENFNDATYHGMRVGAKWIFNDSWDLLLQHHVQTINADGVFDYDPTVGDLEVERFNPDTLRDEFSQTSWTVEGRVGALELLYTGAYLKRELEQNIDYSNYANTGLYIRGYMCEYNTPWYHGGGGVGYNFDPTLSGDPGVIECNNSGAGFAAIENEFERITHEARIVTDQTQRLRFTGGVFFENYESLHTADFNYGDSEWATVKPQRLSPIQANDRGEKARTVQFVNDITRPQDQIAAFGELTFDIMPNLAATIGARWYEIEVGFEGFSAWKYGNQPVPNLANGNNANGIILEADGDDSDGSSLYPDITGGRDYITNIGGFQPTTVDDVITKFTLNWFANNDMMVYAT
ncbi:MAG: TonB-dependent receptor, partial [Pseudomonadales bacterium]|nr:TonB-dependent receptor [Pseudomonadales bacterium]